MRKAIGTAAVAAAIALGAAGCKMERGSDAQHPATQGEVVKPQAGQETPATGGSGTGQDTGAATAPSEEYPPKTQPEQRESDEAQQGQGSEAKGFQGEGYKR